MFARQLRAWSVIISVSIICVVRRCSRNKIPQLCNVHGWWKCSPQEIAVCTHRDKPNYCSDIFQERKVKRMQYCVSIILVSCTSSKFPFHLRRRAEDESHHLHWPVNIKWIQLNSSQMPLLCYTYTYMCHHDDAIQRSDCMTLLQFCVTSAASSWFQ